MNRRCGFVLLLCLGVTVCADESEWLGAESQLNSIGIRLGGGLIRYKAIIGGELDNTVYASIDQALSEQFNLIAMLAQSTADDLTYGELSLYYRW